jgi:hypothetical protein
MEQQTACTERYECPHHIVYYPLLLSVVHPTGIKLPERSARIE